MTCREKLAKESPEAIGGWYRGGCAGCPHNYGYLTKPDYCDGRSRDDMCTKCWDREVPNTKESETGIPWDKIRKIIDDAMEKRDRTVSVYFHPENGFSLNVCPWPGAEDLYEMYKDGKITANDFREMMRLPRVKPSRREILERSKELLEARKKKLDISKE